MRVVLDADLCTGHGRCYSLAPEVFDADDDGHCIIPGDGEVLPAQEKRAELGVANCPERALRIEAAAAT